MPRPSRSARASPVTGCTTAWSRLAGARRCRSRSATCSCCPSSSSRSDPRAYRLLVLQSHYRAPIEVTPTTLSDAAAALGRLDALSGRLAEAGAIERAQVPTPKCWTRSRSRMQDDLDTPRATAVLFEAIRRANIAFDAREACTGRASSARAVLECFAAVGLEAKGVDRDPGLGARARPPPRRGPSRARLRRRRRPARRDRRSRLRRRGHRRQARGSVAEPGLPDSLPLRSSGKNCCRRTRADLG